jgi:hypothetical protein
MDPAGADLEKEEDLQRFQPQCFPRKEITRQQLLLVLARDAARQVLLCWTRLRRSGNALPFEDSSDGRAPHTIAELEELSFNVALSRAWVLFG